MIINRVVIIALLVTSSSTSSTLDYLNSLRVKSGAHSLKYSSTLAKAAKKHALYIYKNHEYSHYENRAGANYFARTPWDRIVKAGYNTRVVTENISFSERSYKESIDKIMATVYHRLAFLYMQVDSIGFGNVGSIFVYDMSNSKIGKICSKHYRDAPYIIDNICPNLKDIVPKSFYDIGLNSIIKKSKPIVKFPYSGQRSVPLSGEEETPKFIYQKFGYPITVTFNPKYYSRVSLVSFKLFRKSNSIDSKVVTYSNDINAKIRKNTFVLVPLKQLRKGSKYSVVLKVKVKGVLKVVKWSFYTKS